MGELELSTSLARSKRLDSWQTRWNLPRPSLVGLSAGSCFSLIAKAPIAASALRRLEQSGIGERRAEGYGQLCFNSKLLIGRDIHLTKEQSVPSPSESVPMDAQQLAYAQIIQKAAWRQAIQRRSASLDALQRQKLIGVRVDQLKPSMSQLSNLRSIIMGVSPDILGTEAQAWIRNIPDSVKDKWPDKMAASTKLFQQKQQVWEILGIDTELQSLTITGNDLDPMKEELWAETVRAVVIDSIRSHKRATENTGGDQDG